MKSPIPGSLPLILVTGATGQVGYELVRELAPLGHIVAPARCELDLARPDSVTRAVRELAPRVIINAAAYTAVDQAESDADACTAINVTAPAVLAAEARSLGAVLVHYSTDYVFDGSKTTPYVEDDAPCPLQVYGRTKLEGEQAIAAAGGGAHLILRTSWVYGLHGRSFLRTMLARARTQPELRVVADQVGAPTWSRMVAAGTAQIVGSLLRASDRPADALGSRAGVYHLTAGGSTSWHGFAEEILRCDPARREHVCQVVRPVRTAEFPMPARRPRYSVLDNRRVHTAFGITLPDWREQLRLAFAG